VYEILEGLLNAIEKSSLLLGMGFDAGQKPKTCFLKF
jgi:hypothetical protein